MAGKPDYLADFDSASAMLSALGRFLSGRDFPMLGAVPRWAMPLVKALSGGVNRLPALLQEQVYIWSGWWEAIGASRIDRISEIDLSRWAVGQYPKRRYPAVAIGSSNGAATHLWAALGIATLGSAFLSGADFATIADGCAVLLVAATALTVWLARTERAQATGSNASIASSLEMAPVSAAMTSSASG